MSRRAALGLLNPRLLHLLIPLLILLPVLWALLPGGLPNSADGMVHFTRITEIVSSWRDGILIPRWSLNLGFGYGIPVFIFGPPLSYWIGAAYNILGLGPEAAYKAMLVTVLVIGATGSYRLGEALLGVWAGVVAAVAFVYAPNQLFTLFVQGNAPQLLAWSLMAWALWATIEIFRASTQRQRLIYALALAFTVSGTLISHNVVTLILVPTVAGLGLCLWVATRDHRALAFAAGGGLLGGMMSAWFVVPALLETVYASTDAIAATDYRAHFVPLFELLAWPTRLDAGAINPYIPRTLGMPQVIVALVGLLLLVGWLVIRRREPVVWAVAIFMTLYALFCGWMTTRWSVALWEHLPLLEYLQFPARWIGFGGFALAWLAAVGVGVAPRRVQPWVAATASLFLLLPALVYLYPDKTPVGTRIMSPYYVVRYEVRSGAIGTTSYGEFNPRWAPRPLPQSPMVEDYMERRPVDRLKGVLPEGASHTILEVTAHRQRYAITLPAPATISINLLYFPGWRATVNGSPVEIWPQEGTGLITVDLPAGENILDLTFGPTPLRRAMGLISTAAWIGLGILVVMVQMRRPGTQERTPLVEHISSPQEMGRGMALTGAAVAVTLALQVVGAEWFQLFSPPDQALVATIQRHDDVGELFRLLGQEPLPTTVRAGATLPVVAYWRALDDMDDNYRVSLQVVEVANGQPLVQMVQPHPNNIPTSGWATGLYVRNEWQVTIPQDALPVQYALGIGFLHPKTGEMLPTAQGTTVELGRFWVLPSQAPKPPNGPRAHFGDIIELLGAATDGEALTLYWRANAPVTGEYTIFVHLLDASGAMLGQLDGLPFDNRYPVWAWQPTQVIEDRRAVSAAGIDPEAISHIAVGIYDPIANQRLAASDEAGLPLQDNALMIPWHKEPK